MLDKLLHFVLHQRLLVVLAAIVLLGAGIVAWTHLPIDAFPDVTNQQVMILTEAPGLTPTEVERLVTFPIEIDMGGLPGIRQVRSLSKTGLSQVIVIFEDHVDIYFARQVVFERLQQITDQLPEGIEPELGPISTGLGEIYQYVLEGATSTSIKATTALLTSKFGRVRNTDARIVGAASTSIKPLPKVNTALSHKGFENDSELGSQPPVTPISWSERSQQFRRICQTIPYDSRPSSFT